ncbi:Uncharacterised protein [uncultured archaeon]|nr:Uncharacterised protein [uncultured archaeon]
MNQYHQYNPIKKIWNRFQVGRLSKKYGIKKTSKEVLHALAKEKAAKTKDGKPWAGILDFSLNPDNPSLGSFELDYNDIFVARLVKAGYQGKNDKEIVNQWFSDVCAGVASELFEQDMADPEKRRQVEPTIKQQEERDDRASNLSNEFRATQ